MKKWNLSGYKMINKNLSSDNVELRAINPDRHNPQCPWLEHALFINGEKKGEYRDNPLEAAFDFYNIIEKETWSNSDWSKPLAINPLG